MKNGYTYGANISYSNAHNTYSGSGLYRLRRTIPQSLLDRLNRPNATVQILMTVTAGYWLKGAVQHSGRTYKYTNIPAPVDSVLFNNGEVGLTSVASAVACVAANGSYYYDPAAAILYVNPPNPSSRTIFDDTYQAKLVFRFARKDRNFRGVPWQGRLVNAPSLSLRIDSRFSGVGQIGGGSLTLANRDHYFDTLEELQWDAGRVSMEIGIDLASGAELSEADYQPVGSWRIEKVGRSGENFVMQLREPKSNLELKIPRREFTREKFPAIAQDMIGKPIPWAWGKLFGVKPIVANKSQRRFKLADHPIRSIEQVRTRNADGQWTTVNVETQNLTEAQFTLASADWDDNQEVSVDFFGRTNADGSLMENPSDVMADLLDYCGETALDADSFAMSRSWYRVGTNLHGEEVTTLAPCIYLDSQRTGIEVAGEINSIAGSFLFVDHHGLWRYGAFRPVRGDDLDPMAGTIIQSFTERDVIRGSISREIDSTKVISKLTVQHSRRRLDDWSEREVVESLENQRLHNLNPEFSETRTVGLGNKRDARYWGERFLITEALPLTKYTFGMLWKSFFILPGDKIRIEHSRFQLNSVLEVLEAHYNFNSPPSVKFVAGDNRGLVDKFGFWTPLGGGDGIPLPGLNCWLDAADLEYSHGDSITAWNDKSGRGNHATQSDFGSRPIYNAFAGVREEPGVQFGVGKFFDLPAFTEDYTAGDIFIITKSFDDPASNNDLSTLYKIGSDTVWPDTSGVIREGFGMSSTLVTVNPAVSLTGFALSEVAINNSTLTGRLNNSSIYTATGGGVDYTLQFSSVNYLGRGNSASTSYSGFVFEVIIYNRVLSTAERAQVVQYLSDKYQLGIAAVAPSPDWDSGWTDAEARAYRQSYGWWTGKTGAVENEMADATDARSHRASIWY